MKDKERKLIEFAIAYIKARCNTRVLLNSNWQDNIIGMDDMFLAEDTALVNLELAVNNFEKGCIDETM